MLCYTTEVEARDAGELVYRSHDGLQAWCLCPNCTITHSGRRKRRTRHDRWALAHCDSRIQADLARSTDAADSET